MADLSILGKEDKLFVTRLLSEEPELGITIDWAKRLNAMLRHKAVEKLDDVLTTVALQPATARRHYPASRSGQA